jgi:Ca2+/H+ antiporter, TMEM165/GDT1 family
MKRTARFLAFALLAAAAFAVIGFIVMSLWNAILPGATGWHRITYLQALGLLLLAKILFGGLGGPRMHWRRRMTSNMSPEEREKFREAIRARCGWHRDAGANHTGTL